MEKDKKTLLSNYFSLTVLQSLNYILPLITVPYLVRILGPSKFGIVCFAQAFIQYFIIFSDYGFNLSAPKEISIDRENNEKISAIFSAIIWIKILLALISFTIIFLIIYFSDKFRADFYIYINSFGIILGNAIFPIWFFQGIEKMQYIMFLNIIVKLIFTVSIFIFIDSAEDYIYVPFINSLGQVFVGLLGLNIIINKFGVRFLKPDLKAIIFQIKNSFFFFLSRISLSIYSITNTFVLGLFTTNEITGYYAAADKLFKAITMMNQPLVSVLYPYIARTKNISLYKKVFSIWTTASVLLSIFLFIFSKNVTYILFGSGYSDTILIIKIFSFGIPIIFVSVMLGLPLLAALGHSKYFNISVIIGSIFHILGLVIILPFLNVYFVAILTIFTEFVVFLLRLYRTSKYKLFKKPKEIIICK